MISHDGHAWDVGGYPIFRSTGMYTETQEGYQQFCWLNQTTSSEEQQAEKKKLIDHLRFWQQHMVFPITKQNSIRIDPGR
jgi:hypothetical protein